MAGLGVVMQRHPLYSTF